MAGRKPEDSLRVASEVEGATDGTRVGEKIGVAQHDAFGPAGRAGGVLDHRERIGVRIVLGPAVGMVVGELVGRNPADRCGPAVDCLHIGDGGGGAEHHGRSGVVDERVEAIERSCPGRVDGHGDTAGVERTEKGGDELEAGRVGKHDIPTRESHVLEAHGDRPGAPVQLRVSQRRLRRIAIEQVHECDVVGAFGGKFAQAADDVPETPSRVGLCPRRDPDRGRSLEPQQRNGSRTRQRAGDFVVRQIVLGAADRMAVVPSHRIDQMRPHLIDGECRRTLERHCCLPSRCRMEFRRTVVRMPPP